MIYLYQAYGQITVCEQVLFSILSLKKFLRFQDRVLIYTDRPELFITFFKDVLPPEQIVCRKLTPEKIAEWQGAARFVHRLKICMIADALQKSNREPILYLDGDTVFVEDPTSIEIKIQDGDLIMHEDEGRLNEAPNVLTKKIYKFLKKTDLSFSLPDNTTMHNAGVLGVRDPALADRALAVSDELHAKYPKHVMEQLAFSLVFEQEGPIYLATREVHHYWRTKEQSFGLISAFLRTHPYAERALANQKDFEKLVSYFRNENGKLLTVPVALAGSKVSRAEKSWWRRWWKWGR